MKKQIHLARAAAMMLLVLLLMAAQTAWAQDPSLESLEKESDNVYLIKSADDLNTLSAYVNAGNECVGLTFRVTANITFSPPANEDESNFTAIGTRDSKFRGTFDGGNNLGYTIRGIRINGSTYGQGLFGNIDDARIQNVTIEDAVIKSTSDCVGGIVGSSDNSTIANCTSSATVTGVDWTSMYGGIAGNNDGTITNCTSRATVSARSDCGGIAGSNNGKIENCTSSAKVSARSKCGGIAGYNLGGTITNCTTSNATVSVTQSEFGAIAGSDYKGTYSNNYYYNCTVNNNPNATEVGINGADKDGAVSTTKNFVKIILPECFEITGGVIYGNNYVEDGAEIKFTLKFGYILTSAVTMNGTDLSADDGIYKVKITGKITAEFENGWNIYTADDLKKFSEMVNSGNSFDGEIVTLKNSIDLSNVTGFTPIGTENNRFKGTFDGGGNTLTLALEGGIDEKFLAPFRCVEGATFKKLIVAGTIKSIIQLEEAYLNPKDGTHGGFVGLCYNGATFEDCAFMGSLLGSKANRCGGFVGAAMNSATISYKNCLFAPEKITMSADGSATFNRYDTPSDYSTCYYTQSFGEVQGIKVVKKQEDSPLNAIYKCQTLKFADGNEYYEPVVVEGLCKGYWSTDATIFTAVKCGENTLDTETDYTVEYKDEKGEVINSIAAPGKYTLTITGKGDYAGTLTHFFVIFSGTGEENDPYIITTPAHLDALSALVSGGDGCQNKHFKLGNPIKCDEENNFTPIGTSKNKFQGTFDGGGYTLTLALKGGESDLAPFSFVKGATFRNLIVAGAIEFESETSKFCCHGGFVGVSYGNTTFENCAFVGSLLGVNANGNGGFVGGAYAKITYTNCLFAPEKITMSADGSATFNRVDNQEDYSTCYYTQSFGTVQGIKVYKKQEASPFNAIYKSQAIKLADGNEYYLSAVVEGLSSVYWGSNATIFTAVKCGEKTLDAETDYTVEYKDEKGEVINSIAAPGKYTLTITGKGDYAGTLTHFFVIFSGTGEENDPYIITTPAHLDALSALVSGGDGCQNKHFKLGNPIKCDTENNFTPIGTESHPFQGTFDGGGNTLTVALKYGNKQKFCAPFSVVKGATFSNLIVAGTIESAFEKSDDGTHGGFVGVSSGETSFENCAFVGSLLGGNAHSNGGFVGWAKNKITYTKCLFAPKEITMSDYNSATFNRNANQEDFSTCYYTKSFGTEQGVKVYKLTLLDDITTDAQAVFEYNGVSYYVSGSEIELSEKNYYLNGESASGNLKIEGDCVVSKTEVPAILINGDGDAAVSVPELEKANVTYTRTLSADIYTTIMLPFDFKATDFGGETFYTFTGVNAETWTATMDAVAADAQGVVTLKANTPYIFQPSQETAKNSSFTFNNVKLTTEGDQATIVKGWTFHGTYEKKVWNEDKTKERTTTNIYGFAATASTNNANEEIYAGDFVRAGYNASIRPTRAYLKYNGEDKTLSKTALALPERIKVVFIDNETATVIDDPNITDDPNVDISTPTSEIQSALDNVKVWSYDKTIFISTRPGTDYRIIDASGRLLRASTTQSDRDEIRLGRASGIVIVIIGNKAYKLSN